MRDTEIHNQSQEKDYDLFLGIPIKKKVKPNICWSGFGNIKLKREFPMWMIMPHIQKGWSIPERNMSGSAYNYVWSEVVVK